MGKRLSWVDNIKAFGIILVVWGHTLDTPFSTWFYVFHMPVFFFAGGFYIKKEFAFRQMLTKKFQSIMLPFYGFALFYYPYWFVYVRRMRASLVDMEWWEPFAGMVYGNGAKMDWLSMDGPLWFLPVFFLSVIVVSLLIRYLYNNNGLGRFSKIYGIVAVIGIALLGFYARNSFPYNLPLGLNIMLNSAPFMFLGYLFFNELKVVVPEKYNFLLMLVFLLLSMLYVPEVDLVFGMLGDSVVGFYFAAVSGILFLVYLSKTINLGFLTYLGEKSLFIFALHFPLLRFIRQNAHLHLNISYQDLTQSYSYTFGLVVITIGLSLIAEYLFRTLVKKRLMNLLRL